MTNSTVPRQSHYYMVSTAPLKLCFRTSKCNILIQILRATRKMCPSNLKGPLIVYRHATWYLLVLYEDSQVNNRFNDNSLKAESIFSLHLSCISQKAAFELFNSQFKAQKSGTDCNGR